MSARHVGPLAKYQARSHGGVRGGSAPPPGQIWAPPRLPVPFPVTIGIEVYPPRPGILSAPPLLTIPGYGAAKYRAGHAHHLPLIGHGRAGSGC